MSFEYPRCDTCLGEVSRLKNLAILENIIIEHIHGGDLEDNGYSRRDWEFSEFSESDKQKIANSIIDSYKANLTNNQASETKGE